MSDIMPETAREHVAANPYQGHFKRVLCVCSGGILRSPTAAVVLSQHPYAFNTRSAGIEPYALTRIDPVLLQWADEVVCMENQHEASVIDMAAFVGIKHPTLVVLDIPDRYSYRAPELMRLIRTNYELRKK